MVTHAGFQPRTVRRRFGALLPVFTSFFCFLCSLRADIVYLDDAGNVISSEKTEYDRNGNIVVVPAEKAEKEKATPPREVEEETANADLPALPEHWIADGHGDHFDLNDDGISVISNGGGIAGAVLRFAPPDAVNLVIPDGVTEIDGKAFRQCKKLESVVFPNSVERIPSNIFYENKTLKSVVIPAHASIGYSAFNGCTALESVTIVNPDDENAASPLKGASIGNNAFSRCSALRTVDIPDGVEMIEVYAFTGRDSLESVSIPNSVHSIGMEAFNECRKLKTVTIPVHASIYKKAFHFCVALESVTLTKGGEAAAPPVREDAIIEDEAFSWCMKLKHFEFPEGIRSIGKKAFISCDMESVTVPEGVETIGEDAFCQCAAMKTLHLPDSVKTIGADAFINCVALADLRLPSGPVDFGGHAFESCFALKHFKFPPLSSKELPNILYNCRGLETVELPAGITSIGENAFESCQEMKEVTIPEGVETIKYRAFAGCPKLERVILPASLKTLESAAFGWCAALKEITIPEGMKTIAADAFRDTPCWNSVRKQAETRHIKIKYGE